MDGNAAAKSDGTDSHKGTGQTSVKNEGGSVVAITDADVTINGKTKEEGGKIVKI